ncbi:MAG: hypothetical protein ACFCUI_08575 [Bernardetiaceae bacterium]
MPAWLYRRFIPHQMADIFTALVLGQGILVTGYALFKTEGQTMFVLAVPFLWWAYRVWLLQERPFSGSSSRWTIPLLLLFSLVVYGWEAFFFLDEAGAGQIVFTDLNFYARVANAMRLVGLESIKAQFYFLDPTLSPGIDLYHFYELWLTALSIDIWNLPPNYAYLLVAMPSIYFISLLGLYALLECYAAEVKPWLFAGLAILLLFVKGIHFDFYESNRLMQYSTYLLYEQLLWKKVSVYQPLILLAMIWFSRRNFKQGLILLFLLPIYAITTFPAISGAALILWLALWYWRRLSLRQMLWGIGAVGLYLFVFLLWYQELKTVSSLTPKTALDTLFQFDLGTLKTKVSFFVGTLIKTVLLYLPFFLIPLLWVRPYALVKAHKETWLWLVGLFASGLLTWAILYGMDQVRQLHLHTAAIAWMLAAALTAMHVWESQRGRWAFLVVFVGLAMFNVYDSFQKQRYFIQSETLRYTTDYLLQIKTSLPQNRLCYGVSITAPEEYPRLKQGYTPHMMQRGEYLSNFYTQTMTYQMDNFLEAMKYVPNYRTQDLLYLPFYRFVERQKAAGTFLDIPSSQADFFLTHKFDYLIASPEAVVPKAIRQRAKRVLTDPKSGERFFIFVPL